MYVTHHINFDILLNRPKLILKPQILLESKARGVEKAERTHEVREHFSTARNAAIEQKMGL